ncbi:MAG: MG2 domain-containing protein [Ferruginibacter sp.]
MDSDRAQRLGKFTATFYRILLCCTVAAAFFACNKSDKWIEVDPAYSNYVDAYTTGVISKTSSIRIRLAGNQGTVHTVGETVSEDLFDFSPNLKGKAAWIDASTIEFKPDEWLKPDQRYEVKFKLGKVAKVPEKFKLFRFNVQTVKPAFKVTENGLRANGVKNKMTFSGQVETADVEKGETVEKMVEARYKGNNLKLNWQHNDAAKTHVFSAENIERTASVQNLELSWNGGTAGMDNKGKREIAVPAAGDFKVLNVMAVNEAQQYASVQFSDPIAVGQDLEGLITISGQPDLSYTINGSEVKVFTGGKLNGNFTVNINSGIKNTWGDVLDKGFAANINFENTLPSVSIHGKGNILPNSGRLVLPFNSINLKAVDISIIKIYETNVPFFLQQNTLGGDNELRRVSKPVVQKTLRLDDDKTLDLHKRQHFSLDIDKFLKTEPGALYRVTIGFRPEYSLYARVDTSANGSAPDEGESYEGEDEYGYRDASYEGVDDDEDFWNRYDTYYPYGYNWERRNDPLSKSYYNKDRWASRNILASNIGLTAKRDNYNALSVAVTNILTTEPMGNVELEVMDYQLAIIGKGQSNGDGFANIELKRKPYLLIAKNKNERGYLKLDDGSSLPLSRFDVSGEEVKNGIKGFIFGERGVWRPGDTMYINAIIEDKENKLPKDHPVEFSLYTPRGQLYKQAVQTGAEDGFYLFQTNTDANAPTGNWTARVKLGGAVFEKRIKVETVMPNRLKIDLNFGKEPILGVGNTSQGTLNAKWLFGTPGKNLKAKIDASLSSKKTAFPKFAGFVFDNPTADYATQDKTIFDGTVDENGNAVIKPGFEVENAPGMLNANMTVKVFEPGGNFSIDNMSVPYSPYTSYAGVKLPDGEKPFDYLLAGKQHKLQVVNVDNRGNLVNSNAAMDVEFYRIQWRWWWDDNGDNLSNFTQNEYNKLIKKDVVKMNAGRGQWNFGVSENEWGRYLVLVRDPASGHTTGETFYIEDAYWQTRAGEQDQSAASMLSFTAGKEKYNVGEEVQLTIPSSKGGRMLVSIENGSKVIRSFWQQTEQGQTIVKFKAEPSMAPNIYATVSLLQPHAQTVNDLPIRMYGSVPVLVEDPKTILQPQIDIANSIRPEQNVSFSVSEKTGRAMTYSVAIVDDGLLDLTRFKTPDPHAAFYGREALGVKSFDMFDYVIGAWGGDLERILSIGGDEGGGPLNKKSANRFKPVVKYLGPFHLKSGQTQKHSFKLPQYIGSVRTMLVAAANGSYGNAQKTVTVKKPLMMLATVPRVLGPGETIKLPVTIFAMENNIKKVNVSLEANPYLELLAGNNQTVEFNQPGEQVVYFDVKVKEATGIAKVKLQASSGAEKADYDVELDVRNANPPVTSTQLMTLQPGQTWDVTAVPIGLPAGSTAMIEISNIPNLNLQKRLEYLIQYPHGCIEQTTSGVFPQLYVNQLIELDESRKRSVEHNIKAGIGRILNMQTTDGGFGYWPGAREGDSWGSNYAGHFLVEAQTAGYTVSDYALQQWKNYQRGKANAWVPSTSNFYGGDLDQSYRLYTLALAKVPELGAMNRLKEFKYLSNEARWRLAAAYKMVGQEGAALKLISGLPTSFNDPVNPGFTYGSGLRDEAMVLETLTLLGRKDKAKELMETIAADLAQDYWYSTQTTAYSLMAVAKYCGKNESGAKIIAKTNIGGQKTDINSQAYIRQLPVFVNKGSSNVSVTNNGSNMLYVRLVTRGQPLAGDSNIQVRNNTGLLQMNVSYINKNGTTLDVSNIAQGTDFLAKVTITNPGNRGRYTQMALTQVFPSGWEILNARMLGGEEGAYRSSPSEYQDVRDDRVYTYFDIAEKQTLIYYVQLNATYPGRFFMPGTYAEAMYDNNITAGANGKWVNVVP